MNTTGSLDICIGCMFSGKSTELLRTVNRLKTIDTKYIIINSNLDNRYGSEIVSNHNGLTQDCISVSKLYDIMKDPLVQENYKSSQYIIIEEAQFFEDLYDFVLQAVNTDYKRVLIYGLDGDSEQKPFGDILRLIPHSDSVQKLKSLCKECNDGTEALFTIRDIDGDLNKKSQIMIGNDNIYKVVCRKHLLEYYDSLY